MVKKGLKHVYVVIEWPLTKKRHLENIELEKDRLKTTAENDIIWRQTKERSQL